jgi:hypothetical protein
VNAVASTQWISKTARLLDDEKLASALVRLMMVMNDIGITNSQMHEWEKTEDRKKKPRARGAILYFGRVQSAHLFEALNIIEEIKRDADLSARVARSDRRIIAFFETVAAFLGSNDHKLMAKMRNVVAFHYDAKLAIRRVRSIVEKYPEHRFAYSMGNETLDWYYELGDLISDGILIRDVFEIKEDQDIAAGALEVLKRLHVIGEAFTNFAGFFIRECCAK